MRVLACMHRNRSKLICYAQQIIFNDVTVRNFIPTRRKWIFSVDKPLTNLQLSQFSPFCTSSASNKGSSKINTIDSLNSSESTSVKKTKVHKKPKLEDTMVELYSVTGELIGERTLHEARQQAFKEGIRLKEITIQNPEDKNVKRQYQLEEKKQKDRSRVYRLNPTITDHDLNIKLKGITGQLRKGSEVSVYINCGFQGEMLESAKELSKRIEEECKEETSSISINPVRQMIACHMEPASKPEPVHKVKTFSREKPASDKQNKQRED